MKGECVRHRGLRHHRHAGDLVSHRGNLAGTVCPLQEGKHHSFEDIKSLELTLTRKLPVIAMVGTMPPIWGFWAPFWGSC